MSPEEAAAAELELVELAEMAEPGDPALNIDGFQDMLHDLPIELLLVVIGITLLLIMVPTGLGSVFAARRRKAAAQHGDGHRSAELPPQQRTPLPRFPGEDEAPPPPSAWLLDHARSAARPAPKEPPPPLEPSDQLDQLASEPGSSWGTPDGKQRVSASFGWDPALLQASRAMQAKISSVDGLFASAEFKTAMQDKLKRNNKHKGLDVECYQEMERKQYYQKMSVVDPDNFRKQFSRPVHDIKSYQTVTPHRAWLVLDQLLNAAVLLGCGIAALSIPTASPLLRALPSLAWLAVLARNWAAGHPSLLSPLFRVYLVYDAWLPDEEDGDAYGGDDDDAFDAHGDDGEEEDDVGEVKRRRGGSGRMYQRVQTVAPWHLQAAAWLVDAALTATTLGAWALLSAMCCGAGWGAWARRRAGLAQRLLNTYAVRESCAATYVARITSPPASPGGFAAYGMLTPLGPMPSGVRWASGAPPSGTYTGSRAGGLSVGRGLTGSLTGGTGFHQRSRTNAIPTPGSGSAHRYGLQ